VRSVLQFRQILASRIQKPDMPTKKTRPIDALKAYFESSMLKISIDVQTLEIKGHQGFHLDYHESVYRQKNLRDLIRDAVPYFALTPNEFSEYVIDKGNLPHANRVAWSRISDARAGAKGDYGELLLFLILMFGMETRVERFVTKVKLRSSSREQIKGYDCAHFTMEEGEPILWLGEAKFHKKFANAKHSLKVSLKSHSDTNYLESELKIIGSNIEINRELNLEWFEKLHNCLNTGKNLRDIKINIPILLTYDSDCINLATECSDGFKKSLAIELKKCINEIISSLSGNSHLNNVFLFVLPLSDVDDLKKNIELVEKANK
jgi:hypothetical protein